jgi:hypothetical protein
VEYGDGGRSAGSASLDGSSALTASSGSAQVIPSISDAAANYKKAYQMSCVTMLITSLSNPVTFNGGAKTTLVKGQQGGTGTLIYQITKNLKTGEKTFLSLYSWDNYKYSDTTLNGAVQEFYSSISGGLKSGTVNFVYADIPGSVNYNIVLNASGWPSAGTYTVLYNGQTQTYNQYNYLLN